LCRCRLAGWKQVKLAGWLPWSNSPGNDEIEMGAQQRKYLLLQKFKIRILKNSLMSGVAAGGVSECRLF
jgi:hypothetical protein